MSDPLSVWIYLLRKGAYRDISHIIINTHNKQQAGNKSICTEKRWEKVMIATNMCSNVFKFQLTIIFLTHFGAGYFFTVLLLQSALK